MNPKEPVWHFLKQVAAKLGFTRTMTAPGSDVVDAVNRQSDQIVNLGDAIAYRVNGNTSIVTVPSGAYVLLINSTITGKTDGLYTTSQPVPANTPIDGTYLSAGTVSGGGLNNLLTTLLASAFLYRSNTGDANTFQDGITLVMNTSTLNTPSENRYAVFTFTLNTSPIRKSQIAFGLGTISIRSYIEPQWSNWRPVVLE